MNNNNKMRDIDWERLHRLMEDGKDPDNLPEVGSDTDEHLLQDILAIRKLSGDMKGWTGVDTAADLALLKSKLSLPEHPSVKVIPIWKKVLKYAAIIAVPLAVSILLFNVRKNPEDAVRYVTIEVPNQQRMVANLPDGSNVQLNAGSRLRYPEAFNANERTVEISGEGYFIVKEDAKRPFSVKANNLTIQVLGTAFNVNTYGQHWQTTLLSGKIAIKIAGKDKLVLAPGQQFQYDTLSKQQQIIAIDSSITLAWTAGKIAFRDVPLSDLLTQLGVLYDYKIQLKNQELGTLHYNLPSMNRPESIQPIMELIKATAAKNLNFSIDTIHRTIVIE